MSFISDAIGDQFEKFVDSRVPGLVKIASGGRVPDFYCRTGGFWLEAKVGNESWGPRLKGYQVENFSEIKEPIVYALGFHNFEDAGKRLSGHSRGRMGQILGKNMGINKVAFVDGDLIRKIWEAERRVNDHGTIEYFMMKQSVFNNIWKRRSFRRFGKEVPSAESYYGFRWDEFYMCEWGKDEEAMTTRNDVRNYGFILDKVRETAAIEYLKENGIISD